jgi:hypothetical protein
VASTSSIRVVKQFTYRGTVRTFSNRYHMGTATPADSAHWTTLSDAIVLAEKAIYMPFASAGAKIIETVGYAPGSEVPVFTKTYSTDGSASFASSMVTTGDSAALIRYSTPDRSTKNHPIYCFNYYHCALVSSSGTAPDTLLAAQASAMLTYGNDWITGFSDGTTTYKRSRPSGDLCTGVTVEPLITHRDLPR